MVVAAEGDRDEGLTGLPGDNAIARLLRGYAQVRESLGGRLPTRDDLGPERLRDALGWLFLAEWAPPTSIVVRLSGIHIDYVLRSNVTGVDFFDLYTPEARPTYSRFYDRIAGHPCGGYTRRAVVVGGHETFDYHSIYLPLAGAGTKVPIIGATAVTGFKRLSAPVDTGSGPYFGAPPLLGLIDLGHGIPDDGFEHMDPAALCSEIELSYGLRLDDDAQSTRSFTTRPPRTG